jgi:glycosyltransferase involved in cell wall biosynthesis
LTARENEIAIRVSVVIPSYNGSAFIREAVESVWRQTLPPVELIVVDDASTDDTCDVIRNLTPASPVPLKLVRLKENSGGPAHPINVGVAASTGDFISVLDQDDVLLPEKIHEQATLIQRHPDLAMVFALSRFLAQTGDGGRPRTDTVVQDQWFPPPAMAELRNAGEKDWGESRVISSAVALQLFLKNGFYPAGYPALTFRRRDWERRGGVDKDLLISSDYEFACWLCTQGSIGFIDRVHYLRREHGDNLCHRRIAMLVECARIQGRYMVQEGWLLAEKAFCRRMKEEFFQAASWAVDNGYYVDALRFYCLCGRILGWDGGALSAVADLMPYCRYLETAHARFVKGVARLHNETSGSGALPVNFEFA